MRLFYPFREPSLTKRLVTPGLEKYRIKLFAYNLLVKSWLYSHSILVVFVIFLIFIWSSSSRGPQFAYWELFHQLVQMSALLQITLSVVRLCSKSLLWSCSCFSRFVTDSLFTSLCRDLAPEWVAESALCFDFSCLDPCFLYYLKALLHITEITSISWHNPVFLFVCVVLVFIVTSIFGCIMLFYEILLCLFDCLFIYLLHSCFTSSIYFLYLIMIIIIIIIILCFNLG